MSLNTSSIRYLITGSFISLFITSLCSGAVLFQTDFSSGWPSGWTVDGLKGASEPAWPTWWWNISDHMNDTGGAGNYVRATDAMSWQSPYPYSVMYTHAFDLADYDTIRIEYDSRIGMDMGGVDDYQTLDVSLHGTSGPWLNIWSNFSHDFLAAHYSFAVPQAAGEDDVVFRFQWCDGPLMGHGGVGGARWNIDNVLITGEFNPSTPPAVPTGVTASDGSFRDKIVVHWDSTPGALHYQVYLLAIDELYFVSTVSEWQAETSFDYTNALPDKRYVFAVAASNTFGMSAFSDAATGALGYGAIRNDFDGDGQSDMSCYDPATGNWYIDKSTAGKTILNWGWDASLPVPADYDGDGKTDVAVYWSTEGNWYINGSAGTYRTVDWGWFATLPVPGDYDGDGEIDIAVYWPETGTWYIDGSSMGYITINWGWSEAIPVPADYDGDGKVDIAVFYPANGNWYIRNSSRANDTINWGWSGTVPVPADYDGDGKADLIVFSESLAQCFINLSGGGSRSFNWPLGQYTLVPGDYSGDREVDLAIYDDQARVWYIEYASGAQQSLPPWLQARGKPSDTQSMLNNECRAD